MARPLVAYALCHYAGSTQREAAEIMGGCSGVAVSLQLKKLHQHATKDKDLKKIVAKLKKREQKRGQALDLGVDIFN